MDRMTYTPPPAHPSRRPFGQVAHNTNTKPPEVGFRSKQRHDIDVDVQIKNESIITANTTSNKLNEYEQKQQQDKKMMIINDSFIIPKRGRIYRGVETNYYYRCWLNDFCCDSPIITLFRLLIVLLMVMICLQTSRYTTEISVTAAAAAAAVSTVESSVADTTDSINGGEFTRLMNDLNQASTAVEQATDAIDTNQTAAATTTTAAATATTTINDLNKLLLANMSVLTDLAGDNNANATDDNFSFNSEAERYVLICNLIFEIAVLCIGIIGNGIVIAIILFFTKGNSVADVYIFNLAIADITFLAGLGFLFITSINDHWVFGNIMCKMFMSLTALNQFASSLLLSLMSFDRYLAVCHPIFSQRYRHPKPAKLICLVLWILCFVLMIPIFIHARTDEENKTCGIFWPDSGVHERVFTLYSFCLGFLLPLVLIVVFYRCVVVKLKSQTESGLSMQSERRTRNRETTNKRVSKLVKAIVATYGVCWLPYWVGQMLIGFSESKNPMSYYTFNQLAASLSYLNSALNPLLYAFLSDSFRRRCSQFWSQSVLSLRIFKRTRTNNNHRSQQTLHATQTSLADANHHHPQPHLPPPPPPAPSTHIDDNNLHIGITDHHCNIINDDGDDNDADAGAADERNNDSIRLNQTTKTTTLTSAGATVVNDRHFQDKCQQQRQNFNNIDNSNSHSNSHSNNNNKGNKERTIKLQIDEQVQAANNHPVSFRKTINLLSFRKLKLVSNKRRKKKSHSPIKCSSSSSSLNKNAHMQQSSSSTNIMARGYTVNGRGADTGTGTSGGGTSILGQTVLLIACICLA